MDRLPRITVSGDLEGDYVVLGDRSGGVLRIAPLPAEGLPTITSLKRTCIACPSQWEGTLDDGRILYARYRGGGLTVGLGRDLDEAVANGGSEDSLLREQIGWDSYMSVEELRAHLCGLLAFPPDLEVEEEL